MSERRLPAWRRALAVCALAAVAASEIRSLRFEQSSRRLKVAARQIRGERIPRANGTGFFFDPGYADFLEEIARRTPKDATVAVLVPARPDLYRYQAVYVLAPRRVVEAGQITQAGYVAIYGRSEERWPPGFALPGGTLLVR